jgi:hypothetical protein
LAPDMVSGRCDRSRVFAGHLSLADWPMVSRVASRVVIGTPGLFGIDQMSRDGAPLGTSGPIRMAIVVYGNNIRIDPDKPPVFCDPAGALGAGIDPWRYCQHLGSNRHQ